MPVSDAQMRAVRKYDAKAYDRYSFRFPKGEVDVVRDFAKAHGESFNAFVIEAIHERMERLSKNAG